MQIRWVDDKSDVGGFVVRAENDYERAIIRRLMQANKGKPELQFCGSVYHTPAFGDGYYESFNFTVKES